MCNILPLGLKILLNLCLNLSSKQETVCQTLRSRRSQVTQISFSFTYVSLVLQICCSYFFISGNFSFSSVFGYGDEC